MSDSKEDPETMSISSMLLFPSLNLIPLFHFSKAFCSTCCYITVYSGSALLWNKQGSMLMGGISPAGST